MSPRSLILRNAPLLTLMLGHFTNDMLGGVLPVLLPEAKSAFDLDTGEATLISLAYISGSSLSQPLFGYLCDRYPRRWFPSVALLWGACFAAGWGFAGSYEIFLLLAAMGGLASGAYHPFGAANAAAVTRESNRNTALSLYTVGGTSGFSIGPLVAVAFLALFGPRGSLVLLVPATIVAFLIYRQMSAVYAARAVNAPVARASGAASRPVEWAILARIVGVVMLKSWVFMSVLQLLPLWYDEQGYGPVFYGPLVTTIILAGAVGTLTGGYLADRIGPKPLLLASTSLIIVPLLILAGFPGWWAFGVGAVFGVIGDASLAIPLVAAQRMLPGRTGVASGMILGLGFVTGGVGVQLTGQLSDLIGIPSALALLSVLAVAGTLVGLSIPERVFRPGPATPAGEVPATPRPVAAHPAPSQGLK